MSATSLRSVAAAPRPKLPKEALYQPPAVAWPTLLLFVLALALWGFGLYGALTGLLPPAVAIALQTIAAFMHFTVLHDGVHRSLLRGHPRLNDLIATIAGSFLGPVVTGAAFRHVHFGHHRNTNDTARDPDLWSGIGPRWRLPLQWATADAMYVVVILREWSQIALRDRVQIVAITLALLGGYGAMWALGYGVQATLYWLLPSRLAILWLAFAFNFLPHHPHQTLQSHNPYAATNARQGGEPLAKWLFLYQNYHVIHHLFPSVPFYRYLRIWNARQAEFTALGTPVVPLFRLE
ncbi:MAG: hypothetical protein NVS9B10_23450 [Nevskia sp.]